MSVCVRLLGFLGGGAAGLVAVGGLVVVGVLVVLGVLGVLVVR